MSGIRLVGVSAGLGMVVLTRKDLLQALASPPARWYVLFLAWAGATLAFSPAPLEGLRLLLKLAYPLLLFMVVAAPERRPDEVRRLGDWTLWGSNPAPADQSHLRGERKLRDGVERVAAGVVTG